MGQVYWTPNALNDVEAYVQFVAKDSPMFAAKLFDEFFKASRRLVLDVRLGWMVPEFGLDSVREILVYSYRLVYEIRNDDEAYVVAVIHGSRDLARNYRPSRS